MSQTLTIDPVETSGSAASAWLRALELTASIPRNRDRVLSTVIKDLATRWDDAPALLSDRESFTYKELAARQNQYARWALEQGLEKGDVVCLLMTNRPEYFAIWLGIASIGGITALLNTNLLGPSLSHCINIVQPKHIIVGAELVEPLTTALSGLTVFPTIWSHGANNQSFQRIDLEIEQQSGEKLADDERRSPSIEDQALCIFTSGTTGLPKAANVSHARVMQWSHWFAGMLDVQPSDRMYNCLPMYHSIGGVLVPGATLVGGGSVVIREKFSASQFWSDIVRWDCTMFQYIGELCRYLLLTTSPSDASGHRVRMACGNGMALEVWNSFKDRFQIPRIFEFYAATEGGLSLFNVEGKPGAIGRVPPYLAHRFSPALVRFDADKGDLARDEYGFCIRCGPNETGEALSKVSDGLLDIGSRFEGYTDRQASEDKILRDALRPGDAWIRTGDLMQKDEKGFYYFVDRLGDTFRWKGENVATSEVAEAISAFPGIRYAKVYGVTIPSAEGRAGMAALVAEDDIDLVAFRKHLMSRLPSYARPIFLRFRNELEVTGTFKFSTIDLAREGYDPASTTDRIFFDDPECEAFIRLDEMLYHRIQSGQIRL